MNIERRFELTDEDSLVLVDIELYDLPFTLAVDTGATHTVIDLTALLMAGYALKDAKGIVQMETAKGILDAYIFEVSEFKALGITLHNFSVCSYDFLANSVLASIDGVLGLDFYKGKVLTIDFQKFIIKLTK